MSHNNAHIREQDGLGGARMATSEADSLDQNGIVIGLAISGGEFIP